MKMKLNLVFLVKFEALEPVQAGVSPVGSVELSDETPTMTIDTAMKEGVSPHLEKGNCYC